MTLDKLFKDLSFGPGANLALLGEGSGIVPESSYARLISRINTALTELHARFRLSQKTITLEAMEGIYLYYLRKEHAANSGIPGYDKYILDSAEEPFTGDILRIEQVNDTTGTEYRFNDRNNFVDTIFFPSFDSVQLVRPLVGYHYVIEYRADHARISTETIDLNTEIRIPAPYYEALLNLIVGRIYQGLNGQDNTVKGQELLAAYERQCAVLEQNNTDVASQSSTNVKPALNGWA